MVCWNQMQQLKEVVAADFEGITPAEEVAGCEGITPYLQGKVSITNPCQCCYCQVCTAGLLALCLHTASQDCILSQSHTSFHTISQTKWVFGHYVSQPKHLGFVLGRWLDESSTTWSNYPVLCRDHSIVNVCILYNVNAGQSSDTNKY